VTSSTVAAAVSESRRRERRHSLLEIARTVPYARLIAVDVLVALGTAVGVILLVLPGIVFYTWFALAAPVVKIERLGVRAALRRSRELVRGNFWQVPILLGLSEVVSSALTSLGQGGSTWLLGKSFLGDWVGGRGCWGGGYASPRGRGGGDDLRADRAQGAGSAGARASGATRSTASSAAMSAT
jgi:hypothetical protein